MTSITIPTCPYLGLYPVPENCIIAHTCGVFQVGIHFCAALFIHSFAFPHQLTFLY
ncbi:MAG: hypothetical protein LBU14_06645 [Candidatus Peribacteria bacterium]|nr:hypothetical protein [Candidatus Peribacteria bacterium]